MDRYDRSYPFSGEVYDLTIRREIDLRKSLGYARYYADRLNLTEMVPHGELTTSGYALANPEKKTAEYLIYLPDGGRVKVDLSSTDGILDVEWFNPGTGVTITGGETVGGSVQLFTAPFGGDAVLYLHRRSNNRRSLSN